MMPSALTLFGIICLLLWLVLFAAIKTPALKQLDEQVLIAFRGILSPKEGPHTSKMERAMRDLTALGGDMVIGFALVCGALILAAKGLSSEAIRYVALIIAARVIGALVKAAVSRTRPQLAGKSLQSFTSSFPSVHTLMSLVTAFAILSAAGFAPVVCLVWSGLISVIIGMTRLYFAVHWPSDIVAGWLAGMAICSFSLIIPLG